LAFLGVGVGATLALNVVLFVTLRGMLDRKKRG
jgi:hypothetical protein